MTIAYEALSKISSQLIDKYIEMVDSRSWSDEELDAKIYSSQFQKNILNSSLNSMMKLSDNAKKDGKNTSELNNSINSCNQEIDEIDQRIQKFEEIKQKLHEFDNQSKGYISDIESLLAAMKMGIDQMEDGIHDKSGKFTFPKESETVWIDDVESLSTKYDGKKQQFVDLMTEKYGLDKQSAEILYDLRSNIIKKCDAEGKDWEYAMYEYNRIIASLAGYTGFTWAQAGTISVKDSDGDINDEFLSLCKNYGLKSKDIEILDKKIKNQHKGNKYTDLGHEAVILAAYFATGQDHSMRTTASKLASGFAGLNIDNKMGVGLVNKDLNNIGSNTFQRWANLSFRGDVISGSGGRADFNSDFDSLNIYSRMQKEEPKNAKEAFKIQDQYNEGVLNGNIDRHDEFIENCGGKFNVMQSLNTFTPGDLYLTNDVKLGGGLQINDTPSNWKTATKNLNKAKKEFYNELTDYKYDNPWRFLFNN